LAKSELARPIRPTSRPFRSCGGGSAAVLWRGALSIRLARRPEFGEVLVRGLNGFLRAGLIRAIGDRKRLADGVGRGYAVPYGSWEDRIAHWKFIRDIPLEDGHPTRATIEHLTECVPRLFRDTPAMFVWGDRDFVFTPAFLEKWKALLPGKEVHRFPDAAHWVVEDAHERIVPLIRDFLARHPIGGTATT
jgi:haloalkane dehalogenase